MLFAWVMLALVVASAAGGLPLDFYGGTCSGVLRVCRDDETPTMLNHNSGKVEKVCEPNLIGHPTVRLSTQASGTPMGISWIAQILLMEQAQIPVMMDDALYAPKDDISDFWRWERKVN